MDSEQPRAVGRCVSSVADSDWRLTIFHVSGYGALSVDARAGVPTIWEKKPLAHDQEFFSVGLEFLLLAYSTAVVIGTLPFYPYKLLGGRLQA